MPHLDGLQQEIVKATNLLAREDELYKSVAEARPDGSTLHIYLGEVECHAMLDMKAALEELGAVPVSLVYDGIYFRPMGLDFGSQAFADRIAHIKSAHGITILNKNVEGEKLGWSTKNQEPAASHGTAAPVAAPPCIGRADIPQLKDLCIPTTTLLSELPGTHMCAAVALHIMGLVSSEPSQRDVAVAP